MPWVRLWIDVFDSEKIAELDDSTYRGWTLILLAAKKQDEDGLLPSAKRLAYWARRPLPVVERWLVDLESSGFLDREGDGYRVHDWDYWQPPKDQTNAARQARHKAKAKAAKKSPPAPPKETETDTHTDTEETVTATPLLRKCNAEVTPLPAPSAGVCEDLEPFQAPIDPPQAVWTPEERRVLDKAAKWWGASNGIEIVGGMLGIYPAAMVDQAVDSHHGKVGRAIHRGRLEGLCRSLWDEGRWKPSERKNKGGVEVPYVPGTPAPNYVAPRIHDPGPSIPADEAYRIMTGRQRGATA